MEGLWWFWPCELCTQLSLTLWQALTLDSPFQLPCLLLSTFPAFQSLRVLSGFQFGYQGVLIRQIDDCDYVAQVTKTLNLPEMPESPEGSNGRMQSPLSGVL